MSNEITIVAPKTIEESERLSGTLAKSALLPDALRGKPGDVLATILTGAELGLAPMQSIRGIAIIKGKPTLSADTMGALVMRRRDICADLEIVELTDAVCTYKARRIGEEKPTLMSFTIQDAQKAGLVGPGGMYTKYPKNMLRARCLSNICRAKFPDICMGLYTAEELGAADGSPPPELPPEPRDITPQSEQPRAQAESLKAKIKAKSQIVDVAANETEQQAEQRAGGVSPPTPPASQSKKDIDPRSLDVDELQVAIKTAREWIEREKPKGAVLVKCNAKLKALVDELEFRASVAEREAMQAEGDVPQ
jgi:hypothetical protein